MVERCQNFRLQNYYYTLNETKEFKIMIKHPLATKGIDHAHLTATDQNNSAHEAQSGSPRLTAVQRN